ncbi:hypothetical protein KIW84_075840 [Lathyrus oleraceus]|uniref:Uncharacterized protein n=1 Tax=Pisum sativum TaxID=3888 RepID=A0A9D4VV11_PEA|nr:hypothetical protein KIW84_075840 [Pisum sativum]
MPMELRFDLNFALGTATPGSDRGSLCVKSLLKHFPVVRFTSSSRHSLLNPHSPKLPHLHRSNFFTPKNLIRHHAQPSFHYTLTKPSLHKTHATFIVNITKPLPVHHSQIHPSSSHPNPLHRHTETTTQPRLSSKHPSSAATSTERLDVLDDERRATGFSVTSGEHCLRNYHPVTSVHGFFDDGNGEIWTVVLESYIVDVPEGNTEKDTRPFAGIVVKLNLQKLAKERTGSNIPQNHLGTTVNKHGCPFDYHTAGRDAIAKANLVAKAEKLDKIKNLVS